MRESFSRQAFMGLLGATLARVAPGEVDIALPFRTDLVQQHGFVHAGVTTAIADSACGYAALSVMPVLTMLGTMIAATGRALVDQVASLVSSPVDLR